MSDTDASAIVYPLFEPLDHPGGKIDKISMRRPTAADFRMIDEGGELGFSIAIVEQISGIHMPFLDRLDSADLYGVVEAVNKAMARPADAPKTKTNADGSVTMPLIVPLRIKGDDTTAPVAELTMPRPKGKDLRAMDRATNDAGKVLALAAHLSGVKLELLETMDGTDFVELQGVSRGFRRPRQTGAGS